MVVTFPAPTVETAVTQERVGLPSRCTVQAPHCAIPPPNFVPVRPRVSRKTQSSGVSGLTSTLCCLPLTFREIISRPPVLNEGEEAPSAARPGRLCDPFTHDQVD